MDQLDKMIRNWEQRLQRAEAAALAVKLQRDADWLAAWRGGDAASYLRTVREGHARVQRAVALYGDHLPTIAAVLAADLDCTAEELLALAQEIADAREAGG